MNRIELREILFPWYEFMIISIQDYLNQYEVTRLINDAISCFNELEYITS